MLFTYLLNRVMFLLKVSIFLSDVKGEWGGGGGGENKLWFKVHFNHLLIC